MATALTESQLSGTWGMGETEDFVKGVKRYDRLIGYATAILMNIVQVLTLLIKGEITPADLVNSVQVTMPMFAPIYGLLDDGSFRPPLHKTQDIYFFFCKSLTEYDRIFIGDELPDYFNSTYETKILIHGWGNWSPFSYFWNLTVDALANPSLDLGPFNIIYVQWKYPARFPMYNTALQYVPDVAMQVAYLIKFIVEKGGANFENIHVIGHSLGGHVAGVTGKRTKNISISGVSNTTLRRITALDPAFPLVTFEPLEDRLTYLDAEFVDVIHSNGKNWRFTLALGLYAPIGDADFYPNGGYEQAGCRKQYPILPLFCHHLRAVEFYFETVRRQSSGFTSVQCEDFVQFKNGYCAENQKVPMGIRTPSTTSGTFFSYTEDTYPFSKS